MIKNASRFFVGVFVLGAVLHVLTYFESTSIFIHFLSKMCLMGGGGGLLGIYGCLKIFGESRTRNILINTGLLILSLGFILGVGEFSVRFMLRDITTTGTSFSYFTKKWSVKNVTYNSLRFREKEISSLKQKNRYRIAVIGDSFTFGYGIKEEERFSNLLQEHFEFKEANIEVLNFGWIGVDTVREHRFLIDILERFNPDFVLLQWLVNDVVDDEHISMMPQRWRLSPSWYLHRHLKYNSALYFLLNETLHSIQMNWGLAREYDEYFRKKWEDPDSRDSQKYKKVLKGFINECKSFDTSLGIVLFPKLMPNMEKKYTFGYIHDLVLEVCVQENIPCLDLRKSIAPFSNEPEYEKLHVNRFDSHPSALANQIAAEAILKRFSRQWETNSLSLKGEFMGQGLSKNFK